MFFLIVTSKNAIKYHHLRKNARKPPIFYKIRQHFPLAVRYEISPSDGNTDPLDLTGNPLGWQHWLRGGQCVPHRIIKKLFFLYGEHL